MDALLNNHVFNKVYEQILGVLTPRSYSKA